MNKLSICIPTYNRATHLRNCLNSLIQSGVAALDEVQICISDNCSTDNTKQIIDDAAARLPVKYRKNASNLGLARNILEVVKMAEGEFVWIVGDDDLFMGGAIERILELIDQNAGVDFFYVNANHLTTEYVQSFPQPFDLAHLPPVMEPFSPRRVSGELPFLRLVDPKISFDFLGGIFLSVFRRKMWQSNVEVLNREALSDTRVFSHFDNTFPHIKVFAHAFAGSTAYFSAEPAAVCLTGAREWAPKYPLVRSVRLIEGLSEYRKNGLPLFQYLYCKNAALGMFFPDLVRLFMNKGQSGFEYVSLWRTLATNCLYPNFYLSLVYPLFRRSFWNKIKNIYSILLGKKVVS